MKERIALLLVISIFAFCFSGLAEQNDGGLLGSIGGLFDNAIDEAGQFVNNAVDDADEFINSAGESIDGVVNDAGNVIGEFWESTSGFASDSWNWAEALVAEQGEAISRYAVEAYGNLNSWLDITGDSSLDTLKGIFDVVSTNLGIAGDKATELWDSVYQYSVEHNIDMVVMAKLTIAILIRIYLSDTKAGEMAGEDIDEIVLDWFSNFNINTEEDAENALSNLEQSLGAE